MELKKIIFLAHVIKTPLITRKFELATDKRRQGSLQQRHEKIKFTKAIISRKKKRQKPNARQKKKKTNIPHITETNKRTKD